MKNCYNNLNVFFMHFLSVAKAFLTFAWSLYFYRELFFDECYHFPC
jgi:hypothetical protein